MMAAKDWSATAVGPTESWPQSLRTVVRLMLDSRYAMWMSWGPERTFFCNDAYLPTVGVKRDWVLGARSDEVWKEIWPDIGPRIERVIAHEPVLRQVLGIGKRRVEADRHDNHDQNYFEPGEAFHQAEYPGFGFSVGR
jgi:hypothetical protein